MKLHCPHKDCLVRIDDFDAIAGPRVKPKENDIGICYKCGGWWVVKSKKLDTYIPTQEELRLMTAENLRKSKQRSTIKYKNNETIDSIEKE